jgi:hypothetical protein
MPRYLIERTFFVNEQEMQAVGRRSKQIATDQFPEISWEHSHVLVDDDGNVKTFCVSQAPDEKTVRAHADSLGQHRVDRIAEIVGDVTPGDFPLN